MLIILVIVVYLYRSKVERFDNAQHRKTVTAVLRDVTRFIEHPELRRIHGRTVVLDFDDTIVHTRPWNTEEHISRSPSHFPGIGPVIRFIKRAAILGYHIVIITARRDRRMVDSNLRSLGIYPDAVFTSPTLRQDLGFKLKVRDKIGQVRHSDLSTRDTYDFLNMPARPPGPILMKIIANVGDQWADVEGEREYLGVKLPDRECTKAWYTFRDLKRRAA